MKATQTWMIVADAGRARGFLALGRKLAPLDGFDFAEQVPSTRELGDDRPGRTSESTGPTRHAYEPPTDPHRQVKRAFADLIADKLVAAERDKAFDRLVIVAAPQLLGDLRAALPDQVRKRITQEVDKDLTKLPEKELMERLEEIIVV